MRRVTVPGERPYDVVIGPGAQAELALVLAGTPKAAVVHAPPLAALAGARRPRSHPLLSVPGWARELAHLIGRASR